MGISLVVNDLLNQGNEPMRSFSGNSVTDLRTNQVTRYVLLNCTLKLNELDGINRNY
ncbi:hypothetical protein [Pedobacter metabolipauper]|uniref:Uncharacterized protein n=1 Tax=Pedobacter metabolipauper TaxID=425513 RepID=A0A4R6T0T6_9SPHI|nr:hypothetical protein [Pedobacter metabolipauper]TDQ10951.1 hypothetical protein ATK78_0061 [Pedobacter metabolipauper]